MSDSLSVFDVSSSNESDFSMVTILSKTIEDTITPLIENLIGSYKSIQCLRCTQPESFLHHISYNHRHLTNNMLPDSNPITKLITVVEQAVFQLLKVAEDIFVESEDYNAQMYRAIRNVKHATQALKNIGHAGLLTYTSLPEVSNLDTLSRNSPISIEEACSGLLLSIFKLLTVADSIDCLEKGKIGVSLTKWLEEIRKVVSTKQLYDKINEYTPNMTHFIRMTKEQQEELAGCVEHEAISQILSLLCRRLAIGCNLLIPACKSCIRHPELENVGNSRDFVIDVLKESANLINKIVERPEIPTDISENCLNNTLSKHVEALKHYFEYSLQEFIETKAYLTSQQQLLKLNYTALEVTKLPTTSQTNQNKIAYYSDSALKSMQHLQDAASGVSAIDSNSYQQLLHDLILNIDCLEETVRMAGLDAILDLLCQVQEHIFRGQLLIGSALNGDSVKTSEFIRQFTEFSEQIQQICKLITSCSYNSHSNTIIDLTLNHLQQFTLQMCYAAQDLCVKPKSRSVRNCLQRLLSCWTQELTILLDTLDSVILLTDMLIACESHITNYSIILIDAVRRNESILIRKYKHNIVTCIYRLLTVADDYLVENRLRMQTKTLSKLTHFQAELKSQSDLFEEKTSNIISTPDTLDTSQYGEYENIVQNICDLVSYIQNEFLLAIQESVECDNSTELNGVSSLGINSHSEMSNSPLDSLEEIYSYKSLTHIRSPSHESMDTQVKEILTSLPQAEFIRLESARDEFTVEQIRLEKEVSKWDETENDIILMARDMCTMMMEMSSFTKGEGPIHNASDLISTANNLAGIAERMVILVEYIINACSDVMIDCKDLSAYLSEIHLYSQQIKITSKVYQDLQKIRQATNNISSLVISSKNLIKCVIKTVTASYIACTKLAKVGNLSTIKGLRLVRWKIKQPIKKPLCRSSSVYSTNSNTSHASKRSKKSSIIPMEMLMNEFQTDLGEQIDFV